MARRGIRSCGLHANTRVTVIQEKRIMKKLEKLLLAVRKAQGVIIEQSDDGFACQLSRSRNYGLRIILSWGAGWDHVSVHATTTNGKDFTPFWEDMCYVKNLFFKPSEMAVQYHPVNDKYVNVHTNTLHLWHPQETEIELPPIWMV